MRIGKHACIVCGYNERDNFHLRSIWPGWCEQEDFLVCMRTRLMTVLKEGGAVSQAIAGGSAASFKLKAVDNYRIGTVARAFNTSRLSWNSDLDNY